MAKYFGLVIINLAVAVILLEATSRITEIKKNVYLLQADLTTSFAKPQNPGISPFEQCETEIPPPHLNIPEYTINLDLPPEKRWRFLVHDKQQEMKNLIENIKRNCLWYFGQTLFWMVDNFIPRLTQTLPDEYIAELQGISQETGINLGEVTLFNLFYEFFSVCTSILAQSEDGTIYHGRNLDFGLFLGWNPINHTWQTTGLLRPLVVQLSFLRANKVLYRSVNYAGYVGILTAVKQNKFSLSIDERFTINGGYIGLAEWIIGMRKQSWIGFLARETMENCDTFLCAQKKLSLQPVVAPVYFILGGAEKAQGCIITRGRRDFQIWHMGQKQRNQTGDWFVVQTNYDQWKSPPFYDNRRSPAITCMDQIGQKNVTKTLSNVLSTRPVLNKLTTYTAVMSAKESILKVWLQFCPDPCWPW